MPKAELVYFPSCPNVAEARARLVKAFVAAKLTPRWTEHRTDDPELPAYARGFGSPTILIEGREVTGAAPAAAGESCRVYGASGGAPPLASIVAALRGSEHPSETVGRFRLTLSALPGLAFALLPKLACPACWPAYAGLLGSLGLGFLIETRWLLPLTALFLLAAVGALVYRAEERHGHVPSLLGLAAAAVILLGKFRLESDPATYAGVALLVAASVWNTWPKRRPRNASCSECAPTGAEAHTSPGATTENER